MSKVPLPSMPTPAPADLSGVTLEEGPPTQGELVKFYPPRYTWEECKALMRTGDLGLLKRHPVLQKRYSVWAAKITKEHGSITKYLVNVRLGWGPQAETNTPPTTTTSPWSSEPSLELNRGASGRSTFSEIPELSYFTSESSADNVKIILNDWPYAIPLEISHFVIWSRLPIVHSAIVHPSVAEQVHRDGLWGFTGADPFISDNTVDGDQHVYYDVAPGTPPAAREHILVAASNVHSFVSNHWPEDQWETAWFVNPPIRHLFLNKEDPVREGSFAHTRFCSEEIEWTLEVQGIIGGPQEPRSSLVYYTRHWK